MNTQIPTPGGTLTLILLHSPTVCVCMGFLKNGQPPEQETYGGCDQPGITELRAALVAGRSVIVHDHHSGDMHARALWDEHAQCLTLRAAGESADVLLDDTARTALVDFLTDVLNAFPARPSASTPHHEAGM